MNTVYKVLPCPGEPHISRAASSVGVMYHVSGPNIGSNPEGGQIQKKKEFYYEKCCQFIFAKYRNLPSTFFG